MNNDKLLRQLHDKATRGEELSSTERQQLDSWYARQDENEHAELVSKSDGETTAKLQAEVDSAVGQLSAVTQQIQALTTANESVRREISELQQRLVQQTRAPSA